MTYTNPRYLRDEELLPQIKAFVQSERDLVVKILHILREVERRRLYSDLGYSSLFDYAVKELKYREGQASRRIQAMRLIKDLPEVEANIATGALSLTNVQQAQALFRDIAIAEPMRVVAKAEKLAVLSKLENKSVREAQREIIKLQSDSALPLPSVRERERVITETVSELRTPMTDRLKTKLEEFRSLLGSKGATLGYAELFEAMADVGNKALREKRFGKKRMQETKQTTTSSLPKKEALPTTPAVTSARLRHIPRATKHAVWTRDKGRCVQCGGTKNLNYDDIVPVAVGGRSTPNNLRLLCFACNQRASAKVFGRIYEARNAP